MPISASATAYHDRRRAMHQCWLDENVTGRDLVGLALADPSQFNPQVAINHHLRNAVLGRIAYNLDIDLMVQRVTHGQVKGSAVLFQQAANPEDWSFPVNLDAWKLVVCDARFPEQGQSIDEMYQAQLQEEEAQTPAERARELVRCVNERKARRNARWFISHLALLQYEEIAKMKLKMPENMNERIWKRASPPAPAWIQRIAESKPQPWGFFFYKTNDLEQWCENEEEDDEWEDRWDSLRWDLTCRPDFAIDRWRSDTDMTILGIHCSGYRKTVHHFYKETWPGGADVPSPEDVSDVTEMQE